MHRKALSYYTVLLGAMCISYSLGSYGLGRVFSEPAAPIPANPPLATTTLQPEVRTASKVIYLVDPIEVSEKQELCLAKNIFYEAGVEPLRGKLAVGQVTLNRVRADRWEDTICKVVFQAKQFSWTRNRALWNVTPTGPLWEASRLAARYLVMGVRLPEFEDALFYHADYVRPPAWASAEYEIAQVGQHIFYFNDRKR